MRSISTIASLLVVVDGNTTPLTAALAKGSASAKSFESGVTKGLGKAVPLAAAAGGIALAAFAVSSVSAAVKFEQAFTRIDAISNATAEQIGQWKDSVMELGGETAQAPNDLADALFFLSSAGLEASQITSTLELSAKAAAVGLGTTTDVAKITANALNAYAKSGLTAAEVTDTLVAAVREGSADPDEFAAALGRILPVAAQAGISFDQVTASLASLSNIGLDVNEGVTAMRGTLLALEAPTNQTQVALKELGLSADDVRASLSGDGLIATLRMLEQRAGGNIDIISKLVPNVRALTGVFGLTGQEASKVNAIFQNVANSTGSLDEAFKTTSQNAAFKLSKAFNDIKIAGEKVAIAILPTLATLASGLGKLIGIIGTLTPLILLMGAAFATWKIMGLVSLALQGLGLALAEVGTGAAAATLTTAGLSVGMTSLMSVLAPVGAGIGAVYLAWKIFTGADPTFVPQLATWLADATVAADGLSEKFHNLAVTQAEAEAHDYSRTLGHLPPYITAAGEAFGKLMDTVKETQERVVNFAGMSTKELTKFQHDTVAAMSAVAGGLDSASNSWRMTAAAAVKATGIMAHEQERMAADLRKLDEMNIGEGLMKKLQELGPGMVDAFVHGNAGQRDKIRANLKMYDQASNDTTSAVKKILSQGMNEAGAQADAGLINGMKGGIPGVEAAARAVALAAVAAAKQALGEASPSKVMALVGADVSIGFAQGIESKMSAVISAIQAVVGEGLSKARLLQAKELEALASDMAQKMERMVTQVQKDWDRLHDQIDSFKDSVRSGFDTLDILGGAAGLGQTLHDDLVASVQAELDAAKLAEAPADIIAALEDKLKAVTDSTVVPSAADFATFLDAQLKTAQEFASALTQLQSMGLNQGLLSELAAQGPASLPFLQALISGGKDVIAQFNTTQGIIDDIAGKTADTLADTYFGERLGKLGDEVDHLRDRLEIMSARLADKVVNLIDAIQAEAVGHKVDDVLKALERLAHNLAVFQPSPGPGNGPGSTSTQSAPYVPGLAAMDAGSGSVSGGGGMSPEDRQALAREVGEEVAAAIARQGGFHPVMVQSEHDAATSRYISKTGAGRRSL